MKTPLTVRQKILVAADDVAAESGRFRVDALVLRAWELFPESFSLGGTDLAHPDSNRVIAKLAGAEGLRGLGWIELVDPGTYRLTRKGQRLATELRPLVTPHTLGAFVPVDASKRTTEARPPGGPISAAAERIAARVKATGDITAVRLMAEGEALRRFQRGSPLTFADACSFWGITSATPSAQQRVAEAGALLTRVVRLFDTKGALDRRLPPLSVCYGLYNLHGVLAVRFTRDLAALTASAASGGATP